MSENDLDAFAASLLADTLAENDCLIALNLSGIICRPENGQIRDKC